MVPWWKASLRRVGREDVSWRGVLRVLASAHDRSRRTNSLQLWSAVHDQANAVTAAAGRTNWTQWVTKAEPTFVKERGRFLLT